MAAVAVTQNKNVALDTVLAITASPATNDQANLTDVFSITPTSPTEKLVITCSNANSHGSVSLSVAAGAFHSASAALTLTIPQNTTNSFVLDPSKYLSSAGVYVITATPATGKILLTNHAFTMTAIENKCI
jgi:hypothetical protein